MSTPIDSQFDRLCRSNVVAILRGVDTDDAIQSVAAIRDGGVQTVEITANSPNVLETIKAVRSVFDEDELMIGAGTVLDSETARETLMAGAEFIVTPSFDEAVVKLANRYGCIVTPGVMTPTEAVNAFEAGAPMVKLFPAGQLGPGHVRSLRGPLPQIPIMPTGGVTTKNVGAFFDAGAAAVGVGSSIVDTEAISAGNFDMLRQNAEAFMNEIDSIHS
jgi:2-dehydro-3-deoxyphosphogluconate aldolase/(4S)-4-hydroxy-2-oxoglutarate aldolase